MSGLTEESRLRTPQLAVFGADVRWMRGHGRQISTRRRSVTSSFGPVGCQLGARRFTYVCNVLAFADLQNSLDCAH